MFDAIEGELSLAAVNARVRLSFYGFLQSWERIGWNCVDAIHKLFLMLG